MAFLLTGTEGDGPSYGASSDLVVFEQSASSLSGSVFPESGARPIGADGYVQDMGALEGFCPGINESTEMLGDAAQDQDLYLVTPYNPELMAPAGVAAYVVPGSDTDDAYTNFVCSDGVAGEDLCSSHVFTNMDSGASTLSPGAAIFDPDPLGPSHSEGLDPLVELFG